MEVEQMRSTASPEHIDEVMWEWSDLMVVCQERDYCTCTPSSCTFDWVCLNHSLYPLILIICSTTAMEFQKYCEEKHRHHSHQIQVGLQMKMMTCG